MGIQLELRNDLDHWRGHRLGRNRMGVLCRAQAGDCQLEPGMIAGGKGSNPRPFSVPLAVYGQNHDAIDWNAREREQRPSPFLQGAGSKINLQGHYTLVGGLIAEISKATP
jgi:hypothetical protein